MQRSSQNKSAEKHVCNEQTSSNMRRNFRLKHFNISRDKKKLNSVTHHKASGLSFTLSLIRGLHQNVTVDRIINQLIIRKCAE